MLRISLVTHPKIYNPQTPVADALLQIRSWLESPTLVLLHESDGFIDTLEPLLKKSGVQGGVVHDARVAALCLRHGVKKLLSTDRDFSRFVGKVELTRGSLGNRASKGFQLHI